MSRTENILELRSVSVRYGGIRALQDVTASLAPGEIVAVMGPNGAGKSTVLKALYGIAAREAGRVMHDGREIMPRPADLVRSGVVFVPQGRRVFPSLTVRENLEITARELMDSGERLARIEELCRLFPVIRDKVRAPAGSLSGGQQQMIALARGLMTRPRAMLLDEPSLGLSPKMVASVFQVMKEINEKQGTAIMVVEHNIKSLLNIVDRCYLLDKGKVIATGSPDDLRATGILEKIFVGALE